MQQVLKCVPAYVPDMCNYCVLYVIMSYSCKSFIKFDIITRSSV